MAYCGLLIGALGVGSLIGAVIGIFVSEWIERR